MEITANSSCVVGVADAKVKANVESGNVEIRLIKCSTSSVSGVVIHKIGTQHNITLIPDIKKNVRLVDAEGSMDSLVIKGSKKNPLHLKYNSSTNTWTIVK